MDEALKRPKWLKGLDWRLRDRARFVDWFSKESGFSREECSKLFKMFWLENKRSPDEIWEQVKYWRRLNG